MKLSYQEFKNKLLIQQIVAPIDLYSAEAIARLYYINSEEAKIWFLLFFIEINENSLFFDPMNIYLTDLYKDFFSDTPLPNFDVILKDWIQLPDQNLNLPIMKVEDKYCLPKTYEEVFEWLDYVQKILEEKQNFSSIYHESSFSLSEEQNTAIELFFMNKWLILTGGPGRGKTFTAKKMVQRFLKEYPNAKILTSAPTGKAAENLCKAIESECENLNLEPKTIHALLKVTPTKLIVDEDDKLDADLIIIDECSMLDFKLFSLLVRKIKNSSKVLCLGDPNQLPPIHGLSPFQLLIELTAFLPNIKHMELTIPFRTNQKGIIQLTDGILNSNFEQIQEALKSDEITVKSIEAFQKDINQKIENFLIYNPSDIDEKKLYFYKVIASHNIGPYGTDAINKSILDKLANWQRKEEILVPVIFLENDDSKKIYNGKMAYYSPFSNQPKIFIQGSQPFLPHMVPKFDYAFAITIHKSQGSEFEYVDIVLQEFNPLSIELMYTAVSRAKKRLSIYGKEENIFLSKNKNDQEENFFKRICLANIKKAIPSICT